MYSFILCLNRLASLSVAHIHSFYLYNSLRPGGIDPHEPGLDLYSVLGLQK